MHHTSLGSVSGTGPERGRGGHSKGNRNRGRGRGRGKGIVENGSSISSAQVQQPARDTLIKEALSPAEPCSNITSTATIGSSQSEGLNGSGAHAPPVVDTAVGKGLVPQIVAGIER